MKSLFTFVAFCLVASLSAQLITVSEDINVNSDVGYEVLGELGGHVLLFRDSRTEFKVQAFNERMRESWTKELELDRRAPKVLGLIPTQEDFTLIYSFRRRGNTIIKAHRYDPAANLVDSATIVDLGFLFYTPRFEVIRSEDRSKALVYFVENQNLIRAYALDVPTQTMIWEKSFSPPDFLYGRNFSQALIDDKGQMTVILERDNFRSRRKSHYYEFHTYDGGGDVEMRTVSMGDFLTYDVFFMADNLNEQIVGAGLYTERNRERANGFFYIRIDPWETGDHFLQFSQFDEEFLQNLLGRDYREGRGLDESSVQELVLRRDGGALLIVERNRQLERRTGAASRVYYDGGVRALVDYYFEEVFVLAVNPDGSIHWETILHKKQYSQDDNGIYSSYFLFRTQERLRFLFNDEIRYENTISEYVINGLGDYRRNSLFSTADLDLRLRFRDALQIANDAVVIPSERRNRLKLVRLDYE